MIHYSESGFRELRVRPVTPSLSLQNPQPRGLGHRISTFTHGKFPIDILVMALDGAGRNVELVGD